MAKRIGEQSFKVTLRVVVRVTVDGDDFAEKHGRMFEALDAVEDSREAVTEALSHAQGEGFAHKFPEVSTELDTVEVEDS